MPKAKRVKVKDKWREKKWVIVEAPPSFGSTPIAYLPLTDPAKAMGRVIETTLYDLLKQDPQHYVIKLRFQITEVVNNKAKSILQGHEYSREYLRSLVRRGSSMVSLINDYVTKDGAKVRVHVVAFTQSRINSSRKYAMRMAAHTVLTKKAANLTYDQFTQEAVLGKIASDIYNEDKKITHLRHIGIKKTKLIGKMVLPEVTAPPEAVVKTETRSTNPFSP
jgi:small subunit ribosomal protein S3Ae